MRHVSRQIIQVAAALFCLSQCLGYSLAQEQVSLGREY